MVPLQFEFAGVFLAIAVVGLLVTLVATIGGTYWVYKDATRRGNDNVAIWTIGTFAGFFFGWIPLGVGVMLIYYFVGRDKAGQQYGSVEEDWN